METERNIQKTLRDTAANVLTEDIEWDEINSRIVKIMKVINGMSKSTGTKETWW